VDEEGDPADLITLRGVFYVVSRRAGKRDIGLGRHLFSQDDGGGRGKERLLGEKERRSIRNSPAEEKKLFRR